MTCSLMDKALVEYMTVSATMGNRYDFLMCLHEYCVCGKKSSLVISGDIGVRRNVISSSASERCPSPGCVMFSSKLFTTFIRFIVRLSL